MVGPPHVSVCDCCAEYKQEEERGAAAREALQWELERVVDAAVLLAFVFDLP